MNERPSIKVGKAAKSERPSIKVGKAAKSFGRGTKSVFSAIGETIVAAAEASAEKDRKIAALEVQMRDLDRQIIDLGGHSRMAIPSLSAGIWSPTNPGHLFTCRSTCTTHHCVTCGERTFGSSVYCIDHRA